MRTWPLEGQEARYSFQTRPRLRCLHSLPQRLAALWRLLEQILGRVLALHQQRHLCSQPMRGTLTRAICCCAALVRLRDRCRTFSRRRLLPRLLQHQQQSLNRRWI